MDKLTIEDIICYFNQGNAVLLNDGHVVGFKHENSTPSDQAECAI